MSAVVTTDAMPMSEGDVLASLLSHESRISHLETRTENHSQRWNDSQQSLVIINAHLSAQDTQLAIANSKLDSLWSIKKMIVASLIATASGSILIWVYNNIQRFHW
jgi:chromosome segregation ATPase